MRLSPIFLSILLSPIVVSSAQSGTAAAVQPKVDVTKQLSGRPAQMQQQSMASTHACPVAFKAEREGSLGLRETKNPGENPGPGLDLTFGADVRRVVEADITVYGWSKQLRMVPAANPPETSESFVLNGTNDAPVMQSLVWMKRLGVVNSVELTRVVFSDGAAWAQSGHLHCTARPSMMVLVGASAR
jgi:hypothetical protein